MRATHRRAVILSGVETSQSEVSTQSKDPSSTTVRMRRRQEFCPQSALALVRAACGVAVLLLASFAALFFGFGLVVLVIRGWHNNHPPSPAGGAPTNGSSGPTGSPRISRTELEQFRDQADKETEQ